MLINFIVKLFIIYPFLVLSKGENLNSKLTELEINENNSNKSSYTEPKITVDIFHGTNNIFVNKTKILSDENLSKYFMKTEYEDVKINQNYTQKSNLKRSINNKKLQKYINGTKKVSKKVETSVKNIFQKSFGMETIKSSSESVKLGTTSVPREKEDFEKFTKNIIPKKSILITSSERHLSNKRSLLYYKKGSQDKESAIKEKEIKELDFVFEFGPGPDIMNERNKNQNYHQIHKRPKKQINSRTFFQNTENNKINEEIKDFEEAFQYNKINNTLPNFFEFPYKDDIFPPISIMETIFFNDFLGKLIKDPLNKMNIIHEKSNILSTFKPITLKSHFKNKICCKSHKKRKHRNNKKDKVDSLLLPVNRPDDFLAFLLKKNIVNQNEKHQDSFKKLDNKTNNRLENVLVDSSKKILIITMEKTKRKGLLSFSVPSVACLLLSLGLLCFAVHFKKKCGNSSIRHIKQTYFEENNARICKCKQFQTIV